MRATHLEMLVAVKLANRAHRYEMYGFKWDAWAPPVFSSAPPGPDSYFARFYSLSCVPR